MLGEKKESDRLPCFYDIFQFLKHGLYFNLSSFVIGEGRGERKGFTSKGLGENP